MGVELVSEPTAQAVERALERIVGERLYLPALSAHEVVVVLAARKDGLVACKVTEVETLHEPSLLEEVEDSIDGREAD